MNLVQVRVEAEEQKSGLAEDLARWEAVSVPLSHGPFDKESSDKIGGSSSVVDSYHLAREEGNPNV